MAQTEVDYLNRVGGALEVGVEKCIGTIKIGGVVYNRYVKVIDCGALPDGINTRKTVPHGITGNYRILRFSIASYNPGNDIGVMFPVVARAVTSVIAQSLIMGSNIEINGNGTDMSSYTQTFATIEYYKIP